MLVHFPAVKRAHSQAWPTIALPAECDHCLGTTWEPVCDMAHTLTYANECYARCNGVVLPGEEGEAAAAEGVQGGACTARECARAPAVLML